MQFRKATKADIPAVAAIYADTHTEIEAGRLSVGWIRSIYPGVHTAEAAVERDDLFVAEVNGEIVGTAIINHRQEEMYADAPWEFEAPDDKVMVLHTLVISGEVKRKGLGGEFLKFYEDYALEHGCRFLRLDTNARNAAARAFYKKHGYDEIGIVPTVFNGIPGVDLVLLEKNLGTNLK